MVYNKHTFVMLIVQVLVEIFMYTKVLLIQ